MSSSIETYRSVSVGTASGRAVILKTYDAAIRFLTRAEAELAGGEDARATLGKARTVVGGLMTALDFDADEGKLPRSLFSLYLFVVERIQTSFLESRDAGLADARRVLETLRSAWEAVPAKEARPIAPDSRSSGFDLTG